jgi:hypothetical protein
MVSSQDRFLTGMLNKASRVGGGLIVGSFFRLPKIFFFRKRYLSFGFWKVIVGFILELF